MPSKRSSGNGLRPEARKKKPRGDTQQPAASARSRANVAPAAPIVVLAGRTNDPENVGAELLRLLGGNAAAVRKGIRKTDEVPPRYAIPDVIEMVKGPGNLSQELNRLRERYPEVFEKELDRLRKLHEVRVPNWYPNLTVRFRDRAGGFKNNNTPVATIYGIIDILVLLPGKSSAELRSQIINVFVRFVGGGV